MTAALVQVPARAFSLAQGDGWGEPDGWRLSPVRQKCPFPCLVGEQRVIGIARPRLILDRIVAEPQEFEKRFDQIPPSLRLVCGSTGVFVVESVP